MKPIKPLYVFLLFWVSFSLKAQQYPVDVQLVVTPPYQQSLRDYWASFEPKIQVYLLLKDLNSPVRNVALRFSLENVQGQPLAQTPDFLQPFQTQLTSGVRKSLSNIELKALFAFENLHGVTEHFYNDLLPEGAYFFCLTAYDVATQTSLSAKARTLVQIRRYTPPLLTLPAQGEVIAKQSQFQHLVFQWMLRDPAPFTQYEFTLKEVWDNSLSPDEAFISGRLVYQGKIPSNTILYGPDKPILLENKRYVWKVRAFTQNPNNPNQRQSFFHNNGESQAFYFDYVSHCNAPKFLTATTKDNTANIRWSGEPVRTNTHSGENGSLYKILYREKGKSWKSQMSNHPQATLIGLKRGRNYVYKVGVACGLGGQNQSVFSEQTYLYSTEQEFVTPHKANDSTSVQCGVKPEIRIKNREPLQEVLGVNETFTAGDFPVTIIRATGSNGVFSGEGYVQVPYLLDTKIKVTFNGIKINSERQLFEGKLVTSYDKTEKNVQFIQEGIGEVFGDAGAKTNKIDFEIAEIKKDENGRIVVIGNPDAKTGIAPQVVLPVGSDYQFSDASGKVWTLDEQGEVTSVGEKADTKLAKNQGKNNLPKGQSPSENFEVKWDFSQSAFAFDASGEIPYKALIKGKKDVFQVVIKQKDSLRYSFHFQTDKGLKVDSKKEKEGVFEISRKGLFDFADEELWVVAKNTKTETEEVISKCVLVHLSEKEVNVTLVPITEGLQIDTETIKEIYAKVGVTLRISTDKVFPVTEKIDTENAFGDLSTYSPHQQEVITQYKSERALKSDVYYVFVGKQEGSQAGYMRLGGQFGFAFLSPALSEREGAKDLARTIAHELGHGIFKLEHPFKKDPSKKGTFRTLMDYAQETGFAHSDWKQINDPKLKIGFFEGQDDGQIYSLKNSPMMVKRYIEYFRCKKQQGGTIHSDADKVNVYAENIEIGGKKYTKIEIEFLGKNNQEFKNSFSPKDYQNDSKEIDNSFTNKTIVTLGKTIRFTLYPKNNFDLIGYLYSNDKSHTETIKRDFVNFVNKKTEKEVVEYVNAIDVCTLSELDFEPIKKALIVLTKNAVDKDKSEAILRLISSISEKDYSDFFALLEANNNQIIKRLINDLDDALIIGNNYYSQFVNTLVQMFVSNPNTWLGKLPKEENAVAEYFANHYLRKTEVKITGIDELINGNSQIIWQSFYYDKETGNINIQQNTSKIQALGGINGKVAYAPVGAPKILKNTQVSPLSPVLFDYSQGEIQPIKILLDNAGYSTGDLVIVPALFLQFGYDKIKAKTIEKSTLLALNGLTIYTQLPAVIQGATMTKRLWAAAEVAAAVGDIAVNTANISPEIKQVVDTYNLAMGAIGLKNLGKGVVNFSKGVSNDILVALKENKGLRNFLTNRYLEWKTLTTKLDNLTDAEKQLISQQEKVWKALGVENIPKSIKGAKWIDDLGIIEKDFKNKITRWVKEGLDEAKLEKTFAQTEDKVKLFSELDNAKSINHQRVIINDYENILGVTKGKYISNSVDDVKENIARKIEGKEFVLKTNQAETFAKDAKLFNRKDIEIIEDLGNGIQFVKIKPGTKLYRVFDGYKPWDNISQTGNTLPKGNYWTFEKPNSISDIIEGTAVMPEWNGMTKIIEIEVPKEGIFVWRGLAARQPASSTTKDFFLKGGAEQVIFDIKQNNVNISEVAQSIKEMK